LAVKPTKLQNPRKINPTRAINPLTTATIVCPRIRIVPDELLSSLLGLSGIEKLDARPGLDVGYLPLPERLDWAQAVSAGSSSAIAISTKQNRIGQCSR
jgi:hypothetical protein